MKTLAKLLGGSTLLALAIAAACGGGSDSSPTPSATPEPTPTPTALIRTPGPTGPPPESEFRLIYREYTPQEDVIWIAQPLDPTQRQEIIRIPHRDGYGVKAALSPDSAWLAYLSLPEAAIGPDNSQAEAYLIDLTTGDRTPTLVATGIDYNYTPFWSPDSQLVYMRQYAGPEFLSSTLTIVRVRATHAPKAGEATPTPTPTLPPGIAPAPTIDPVEVVLKDTVAHVLSFAPFGWADDRKSFFFVQVQGGTAASSLVGIYSPGTADAVDAAHKIGDDNWYAAQAENQRLIDEATANGLPLPDTTVTPAPTPAPDARFVVELSNQQVYDFSLDPSMHNVAYVNQAIDESGDIHNLTFTASLVTAEAKPLTVPGLASGDFVRPEWYLDGRLTVGFIPASGGPGQMLLLTLDGTDVLFLTQPESGFDIPRWWAPDGTWLAVEHRTGTSLANPGDGQIVLVSLTGQRYPVPGTEAASGGTVLGWRKESDIPTPGADQ
jgi:hypothetical protein